MDPGFTDAKFTADSAGDGAASAGCVPPAGRHLVLDPEYLAERHDEAGIWQPQVFPYD